MLSTGPKRCAIGIYCPVSNAEHEWWKNAYKYERHMMQQTSTLPPKSAVLSFKNLLQKLACIYYIKISQAGHIAIATNPASLLMWFYFFGPAEPEFLHLLFNFKYY